VQQSATSLTSVGTQMPRGITPGRDNILAFCPSQLKLVLNLVTPPKES